MDARPETSESIETSVKSRESEFPQQHIAKGIPEFCALGCLKFIHLNGETNCMVSLCVHVHFLEILSCAFAEADTIRYNQSIRNNAALERN